MWTRGWGDQLGSMTRLERCPSAWVPVDEKDTKLGLRGQESEGKIKQIDLISDWSYKTKLHRFIYKTENSIGRPAVPVCTGHALSEVLVSVTGGCR